MIVVEVQLRGRKSKVAIQPNHVSAICPSDTVIGTCKVGMLSGREWNVVGSLDEVLKALGLS